MKKSTAAAAALLALAAALLLPAGKRPFVRPDAQGAAPRTEAESENRSEDRPKIEAGSGAGSSPAPPEAALPPAPAKSIAESEALRTELLQKQTAAAEAAERRAEKKAAFLAEKRAALNAACRAADALENPALSSPGKPEARALPGADFPALQSTLSRIGAEMTVREQTASRGRERRCQPAGSGPAAAECPEELRFYGMDNIPDDMPELPYDMPQGISAATAAQLRDAIGACTENGHSVGFVLLDLTSGQAASCRAGAEYYSASMIKAPYVFSLLDSGLPLDERMERAIRISSNIDYNLLSEEYGRSAFRRYLDEAGTTDTAWASRYSETTPLDMTRLWLRGEALLSGSGSSAAKLREVLRAGYGSAIKAALGRGCVTYSKAGWISYDEDPRYNVYCDGGIVDDGAFPYILVIMSDLDSTGGISPASRLVLALNRLHLEMMSSFLDRKQSRFPAPKPPQTKEEPHPLPGESRPSPVPAGSPDAPHHPAGIPHEKRIPKISE